jgi:DNA-binding transcriptional MerR regulator
VSDWRIDELAQRAGIAVDTIRYYQREGLLGSGERSGRTRRFGPEHLARLERIRALQARRFSLAAIRVLLERDDPGALAGLLAGSDDATYDHDELSDAAGVDPALVPALTGAGLLRDPADHGRSAYDVDDVNVLRAFADLGRLAVPDAALVRIAHLYAEGLEKIHRHLVEVFDVEASDCWDSEHVAAFANLSPADIQRFERSSARCSVPSSTGSRSGSTSRRKSPPTTGPISTRPTSTRAATRTATRVRPSAPGRRRRSKRPPAPGPSTARPGACRRSGWCRRASGRRSRRAR